MIDHLNERRNFDSYSIEPDRGLQVLLADGAATDTIPLLARGANPKYLYICVYGGTLLNIITFAPGGTAPSATNGLILGIQRDNAEVLNVTGYTEISRLETGDGTSGYTLYPLADF